jgi:hypothetical protein
VAVRKGFNDLATVRPDLAERWHPTKNGSLTPNTIIANYRKKVWWLCEKGHESFTTPANRVGSGVGCTVCSNRTIVAGVNDINTTHPELGAQWHPTKNVLLSTEVSFGSQKKAWWVCGEGHEWDATIGSRQKRGCPVCAGKRVLAGFNDLATVQPVLAKEWHPTKNVLKVTEVTQGSGKKVWWLGVCGHEWDATVLNRVFAKSSCPVCANQVILVGFNDLSSTHAGLASEWSSRNTLKVTEITYGADLKAWWECSKGHEWDSTPRGRVRGNGCPECNASNFVSKPEKEINEWVNGLGLATHTSARSIVKKVELDIFVPSKMFAIEFNGLYWHSDVFKVNDYHYEKWLACKRDGIQLVQVWEDEWNENPGQVKRMLAHKLGVSQERKVFGRKTVVVSVSKAVAETFLDVNHVQGYASGSFYLGLREKGEAGALVAVLVLKKEAGTDGETLNIIRYATNASVVGGFTKLLKYVEVVLNPARVITFSDNCVSDGGLYAGNGFVADKELKPDYMYIVKGVRKHKFGYRLKRFREDPELKYDAGLTERELAVLNGLWRVYDAGKTRWVKERVQ